jgi:hypothetical protein
MAARSSANGSRSASPNTNVIQMPHKFQDKNFQMCSGERNNDSHGSRLVWAAAALVVLTLLCGPAVGRCVAAELLLNPKYVPRDFPINVVLDGVHGFHRVVRRRMVVQVPPGAVKVRVTAVTFPRSYRGVPVGSRAYPNGYGPEGRIYPARSQTFTRYPTDGEIDVAKIVYGTIVSADVSALHTAPLSVTGTPSRPSAIGFAPSASRDIKKGQILAQAPTVELPGGLFDRVTAVAQSNGEVEVSLTPAGLQEAFPALSLRGRFPIHSSPTLSTAPGAAPFSFDESLVAAAIGASCPSLTPGWQFQPSGAFLPSLLLAVKGRFLARDSGELGLEAAGTIAFSSSFAGGAHCSFMLGGAQLGSDLNIMGVPVPVTGNVGLAATLDSGGEITSQFLAELDMSSSITFDGYSPPQSKGRIASPKASGAVVTSGGEFTVDPQFEVDLGVDGSIGSLLMSPEVSAIDIGPSGCQVNFGLSGNATAQLNPAQRYSAKLEAPQTPRYRCPGNG